MSSICVLCLFVCVCFSIVFLFVFALCLSRSVCGMPHQAVKSILELHGLLNVTLAQSVSAFLYGLQQLKNQNWKVVLCFDELMKASESTKVCCCSIFDKLSRDSTFFVDDPFTFFFFFCSLFLILDKNHVRPRFANCNICIGYFSGQPKLFRNCFLAGSTPI